jgi:hypothetical protein
MSRIQEEVLEANAAYAASFGDKGKLAIPPAAPTAASRHYQRSVAG